MEAATTSDPTKNLADLPDEMTFELAKKMSAKEMLKFAQSSKENFKWLDDVPLWRYYALRDLCCLEKIFDLRMKDTSCPYHLYRLLSQCQHNDSLDFVYCEVAEYHKDDPVFFEECKSYVMKCRDEVVPGTSFCKHHLPGGERNLKVCLFCEFRKAVKFCGQDHPPGFKCDKCQNNQYCLSCTFNKSYTGCSYFHYDHGKGEHHYEQCPNKLIEGTKKCSYHDDRNNAINWHLTWPPPRDPSINS